MQPSDKMWRISLVKSLMVMGHYGPIPVQIPGLFGPIPFRSDRFGPISEVGGFRLILVGRFNLNFF